MKKPNLSLHRVLVDLSIILITVYIILFISIPIIANIALFNLNTYKSNLENFATKNSNYIFKVDRIDSKFTYDYLPELTLNNLTIISKSHPNKLLTFKKVSLNLSYSSLWKLKLIFNKIDINGTKLNFDYAKNGDILLNGILISSLNDQPKPKKNSGNFDVEDWLLSQQNIFLYNINISILDNKHNFKKIELRNINIVYSSSILTNKHLRITINNSKAQNHLYADLQWNGNKLEDIRGWKYGHLQLKTYSDSPIFSKRIQQYIPDIGFIKQYNANTALDATLNNGLLTNLFANLNIKDLSYNIAKSTNIINFPNINGQIRIKLDPKNRTYTINAESIQVATTNGSVIKNKSISGYYTIGKYGYIEALNSNLTGINELLKYFHTTESIKIFGEINKAKISWNGDISKPKNYLFSLHFSDLGIVPTTPNVPQITHVSGSANISDNAGELAFSIESSEFIYKNLFYVPYEIKHINSKIHWVRNSNKTINVVLESTTINAKDFNVAVNGKYIYVPNTPGYLSLYAKLDQAPANRVGYYLPTSIDSANKWLQIALIGGQGKNGTLILDGWLKDFPFANNTGKFFIDADIDNGKLRYIKGWPTIDNVYGKFMIRNQKIIITTNKAKVQNNTISNAKVVIPNMLADNPILEATGDANGSTQNFIDFLKHSPLNKALGNLPNLTIAHGNGNTQLKLAIPLSRPETTSIDGKYIFFNNNIQFNNLQIPTITSTNGQLNFSNHGLTINDISAKTLGGNIKLVANTTPNGLIKFAIQSNNLDYNQIAQFYLPMINPIISGKANANIGFYTTSQGLESIEATSTLQHVQINAPTPLLKNTNESSSLSLQIQNIPEQNQYAINFTYGNALKGKVAIDKSAHITSAKFQIPTDTESLTSNLPAITKIDMAPESFELLSWLQTIQKLFLQNNSGPVSAKITTKTITNRPAISSSSTFPINIALKTPNLLIANTAFGKAQAHTYVTKDIAAFNLNSDQLDGYGVYLFPKNQLNLYIYFANINNSLATNKNPSTPQKNKLLIPYVIESQLITEEIKVSEFNQMLDHAQKQAETYANSTLKAVNIPNTIININHLYYAGNDVGNINLTIKPHNNNLTIESAKWMGKYSTHTMNLTNYCYNCEPYNSLVDVNLNAQFTDIGKALANIKLSGIMAQGSGTAKVHAQWRGGIDNFSLKTIVAKINLDLKNGRFLKVNTGSLLGSIVGIINLQTIVNLASLNFKDIFANGFAFNKLEAELFVLNNVFHLKYLYMSSSLAVVGLKGHINLNNNTVNMYLNITPSLGIGVAVGAGVITLNPLIGVATYLAELALQNPVNKLFAFTFHIKGPISKPKITQIEISKQITKNISSTVGK